MPYWLSAGAGLWFIVVSPGSVTVTDDQDQTGYYGYTNAILYNIKSLRADGIFYSKTDSIEDCLLTDSSFYYDSTTTRLYVHFDNFNPPWGYDIFFGAAIGYSMGGTDHYYNNVYYPPVLSKIFNVKRSKDPLFYGLLQFTSGTVELINASGLFDAWRSWNLYAQPSRIMGGEDGDTYAELDTFFTGSIGPTSRTWSSMSVKNEDIRKRLTQPIARNLLTLAEYPDLNESSVDSPKPVAYGPINNAPCICLNEEESGSPSTYTFLLCDTEWNLVTSLDAVYVEGVDQLSHATLDATAGTFTLSTSYYNPGDNVTASFTIGISNGVEIIKDIISNYDKKPFLNSFWNVGEVTVAASVSRATSLYIDDDTDIKSCIEKICSDIDAIFFAQDNGKYNIRIYNQDRLYSKIILVDDWIDEPKIDDNQDQFLTSVIIKYNHDIDADTWYQYENKDYEDVAFAIYKTYKVKAYETGLTTLAAAIEKSETILDYSANVRDIITRSVKFKTDSDDFTTLEIMDFIICAPESRVNDIPVYALYEVLGLEKNFSTFELKITMRYVGPDPRTSVTYDLIIDDDDNFLTDIDGNFILGATAV